jgi:hypothetical protein
MMCVMPALKPMKAVRCGGLDGSSLGKRCTAEREARHGGTRRMQRRQHTRLGCPPGRQLPPGCPGPARRPSREVQQRMSTLEWHTPGNAPLPWWRCDRFLGRKPSEPQRGCCAREAAAAAAAARQRAVASSERLQPAKTLVLRAGKARRSRQRPRGRRRAHLKLAVRHRGCLATSVVTCAEYATGRG